MTELADDIVAQGISVWLLDLKSLSSWDRILSFADTVVDGYMLNFLCCF